MYSVQKLPLGKSSMWVRPHIRYIVRRSKMSAIDKLSHLDPKPNLCAAWLLKFYQFSTSTWPLTPLKKCLQVWPLLFASAGWFLGLRPKLIWIPNLAFSSLITTTILARLPTLFNLSTFQPFNLNRNLNHTCFAIVTYSSNSPLHNVFYQCEADSEARHEPADAAPIQSREP